MQTFEESSSDSEQTADTVTLFTGPMFSMKTGEMLIKLNRWDFIRNARVLLFKPSLDTRDGDDYVISRNGLKRKADGLITTGEDIWNSIERSMLTFSCVKTTLVIGIDEGQFVKKLDFIVKKVLNHAKEHPNLTMHLYIAGLDSDFEAKPWPSIMEIMPYCTSVNKCLAICTICQERDAQLTKRTIDSKEQVIIGSSEIYAAACYPCYLKDTE